MWLWFSEAEEKRKGGRRRLLLLSFSFFSIVRKSLGFPPLPSLLFFSVSLSPNVGESSLAKLFMFLTVFPPSLPLSPAITVCYQGVKSITPQPSVFGRRRRGEGGPLSGCAAMIYGSLPPLPPKPPPTFSQTFSPTAETKETKDL